MIRGGGFAVDKEGVFQLKVDDVLGIMELQSRTSEGKLEAAYQVRKRPSQVFSKIASHYAVRVKKDVVLHDPDPLPESWVSLTSRIDQVTFYSTASMNDARLDVLIEAKRRDSAPNVKVHGISMLDGMNVDERELIAKFDRNGRLWTSKGLAFRNMTEVQGIVVEAFPEVIKIKEAIIKGNTEMKISPIEALMSGIGGFDEEMIFPSRENINFTRIEAFAKSPISKDLLVVTTQHDVEPFIGDSGNQSRWGISAARVSRTGREFQIKQGGHILIGDFGGGEYIRETDGDQLCLV